MGKRSRTAGFALALVIVGAVGASAQTPYFAVYFDPAFTVQEKNCPGTGPDMLYVAGVGFNTMVTGAEFAISYPPAIMWVADANTPLATIGTTPTGIAMGYSPPRNGLWPVELCRVQIQWLCDSCGAPYLDNEILVRSSPRTGFLGWTDSSFIEHPAWGLISLICPSGVAAEQTTWGRVKAIFGE